MNIERMIGAVVKYYNLIINEYYPKILLQMVDIMIEGGKWRASSREIKGFAVNKKGLHLITRIFIRNRVKNSIENDKIISTWNYESTKGHSIDSVTLE